LLLHDIVFRGDRCASAILLELATGEIHEVQAKAFLLATGGFGKVFKVTSNCFANTGDALSILFEKGFPLQDMEFIQFHPTGIVGLGILMSEAARGEGGILLNDGGERFMEHYAPAIKDLAPRDIVSRSILREVREGRGIKGKDYVHLDLTHLGEDKSASADPPQAPTQAKPARQVNAQQHRHEDHQKPVQKVRYIQPIHGSANQSAFGSLTTFQFYSIRVFAYLKRVRINLIDVYRF